MIDIIINDKLACTCLPELVVLILQTLIPNIGLEVKIETRKHVEIKED